MGTNYSYSPKTSKTTSICQFTGFLLLSQNATFKRKQHSPLISTAFNGVWTESSLFVVSIMLGATRDKWVSIAPFHVALKHRKWAYQEHNDTTHRPFIFCLLYGPPGFNLVFFCSSVPVVLFDTPGIARCRSQHVVSVESSSLFHHSISLWFICFPWWSIDQLENLQLTICLSHNKSWGRGWTGLRPPVF